MIRGGFFEGSDTETGTQVLTKVYLWRGRSRHKEPLWGIFKMLLLCPVNFESGFIVALCVIVRCEEPFSSLRQMLGDTLISISNMQNFRWTATYLYGESPPLSHGQASDRSYSREERKMSLLSTYFFPASINNVNKTTILNEWQACSVCVSVCVCECVCVYEHMQMCVCWWWQFMEVMGGWRRLILEMPQPWSLACHGLQSPPLTCSTYFCPKPVSGITVLWMQEVCSGLDPGKRVGG
jgi:hypothetical protein